MLFIYLIFCDKLLIQKNDKSICFHFIAVYYYMLVNGICQVFFDYFRRCYCIMLNFEELSHKLFSLVIFRNLLNDEVIKSFTELADEQKSEKAKSHYICDRIDSGINLRISAFFNCDELS